MVVTFPWPMVFVGTQILKIVLMHFESLHPLEVALGWRFSLCRWMLRRVLHDDVSLWNHFHRYEAIQKVLLSTMHLRKRCRKYDSVPVPCESTQRHRDQTLGETSIRSIATKDCCGKKCCQLFSRDNKIFEIRGVTCKLLYAISKET